MSKITLKNTEDRIANLAPTKIIVLSFAALIAIGSILLSLPVAARNGQSTNYLDALFTATSAVCVTGLVVYDTYNYWSTFGQIVILLLIQCGGLGIATLATFFSTILGRKVGLKGMLLAQESINFFSFEGVLTLIRRVVAVTFVLEFFGTLMLSIRFIPMFGVKGIYISLFHAVSAFCNAGFDLMGILGKGDFVSLTYFNNDPLVIYTVSFLIIVGGLGFLVWKDLYEFSKTKSLYLHTKVVLVVTAFLIVTGALFFYAFENNNPETMGNLDFWGKINASIFQAITPRTAGFNTISTGDMKEVSKVATIFFMFVGAAPGSTAGGIKVTTIGVLIFAIMSQIHGREETVIFKRKVPQYTVNKALSIAGLAMFLIFTSTTVILAFENLPFINVLYEATSAFGTVGLSTGITPILSPISRFILIITMFAGRVGPLTFAIALTLRAHKRKQDVVYPEGKIVVG